MINKALFVRQFATPGMTRDENNHGTTASLEEIFDYIQKDGWQPLSEEEKQELAILNNSLSEL